MVFKYLASSVGLRPEVFNQHHVVINHSARDSKLLAVARPGKVKDTLVFEVR
jgi:hypothetical protein